jgi:hypothetical protein
MKLREKIDIDNFSDLEKLEYEAKQRLEWFITGYFVHCLGRHFSKTTTETICERYNVELDYFRPWIKKDKITSTFTPEKIKELNEHQQNNSYHPYTCDRNYEECEVYTVPRDYSKDGVLIATEEGWICPCGKYKQNWYH